MLGRSSPRFWTYQRLGRVDGAKHSIYVFIAAVYVGPLLDLCGVGALIAGLTAGSLPGALAVGYAATTLGGLCFIAWVGHGIVTMHSR